MCGSTRNTTIPCSPGRTRACGCRSWYRRPRDGERDLRLLPHIPLALAVGAFIGDDLALAAAVGAGAHAHHAAEHGILRESDLPFAAAAGARFICRAALRARAAAGGAGLVARIADLLHAALGGVHEGKAHLELDVLARGIALHGGIAAEALEDAVENVAEAPAAETAEACAAHAAHARMLLFIVVGSALLLIGEHFVRLVDLLELLCGELIVGVKVGVILLDELFIRRLDLLLRRVLAHAENFVIVLFFCHALFLLSPVKGRQRRPLNNLLMPCGTRRVPYWWNSSSPA